MKNARIIGVSLMFLRGGCWGDNERVMERTNPLHIEGSREMRKTSFTYGEGDDWENGEDARTSGDDLPDWLCAFNADELLIQAAVEVGEAFGIDAELGEDGGV